MAADDGNVSRKTDSRLWFQAVLRPQRSLSPTGFLLLMAVLGFAAFSISAVFWTLGAWPVMGFYGLDVALIFFAFQLNYRSGRIVEAVRLSDHALTVERIGPGGKVLGWSFQPYWVQVVIDEVAGQANQLTLRSHGRELVIGAFLTQDERLHLAAALRRALSHQRRAAINT
ncbi:MAG: DUF2244 domain-containing protein [Sphingomonadales bacterium]